MLPDAQARGSCRPGTIRSRRNALLCGLVNEPSGCCCRHLVDGSQPVGVDRRDDPTNRRTLLAYWSALTRQCETAAAEKSSCANARLRIGCRHQPAKKMDYYSLRPRRTRLKRNEADSTLGVFIGESKKCVVPTMSCATVFGGLYAPKHAEVRPLRLVRPRQSSKQRIERPAKRTPNIRRVNIHFLRDFSLTRSQTAAYNPLVFKIMACALDSCSCRSSISFPA
jgi:hypothetical protein